mgnify:FL=1|jgi:hypothetical protein
MRKLLAIIVLGLLWFNTVLALPKCVGEDSSKWTMCEGTKLRDDGITYVGEFKDGKRHGQGTGTHPYAGNYVGEYRNDLQNGYGTMINHFKKITVKYQGNFKDGNVSGQGTLLLPDETKYSGEWVGGMYLKIKAKNGNDAIINAYSGVITQGEFKDSDIKKGSINGQAIVINLNGDKYVGELINSKFIKGTITFADGYKYVGEFKDGKPNGKGTSTYPNGDKYVGEFKDGRSNGKGTVTYADGTKIVGEFKNGKLIE